MELTTLSSTQTHRHPPTAGEEDQNQSSTSPPVPPATSPRSQSKIHEATSLLSQVKTWWSNNIRLVIVVHSSAEPVPSSTEDQGQDQDQARAQNQPWAQDQSQAQSQSPAQDQSQLQDQVQIQDQTQAQDQAQAQSQPQTQTQDQDPNQNQPKLNDVTAEEKALKAQPSSTPTTSTPPDAPFEPDHRDFLALERTFLAYVRTSTALVSFGVIVTQLFVFKKVNPTIGVTVGAVCEAGGIVIVLVGCARYFRQQRLLMQGKTAAAGWDMLAILAVLGGVLVGIFVIVLVQR